MDGMVLPGGMPPSVVEEQRRHAAVQLSIASFNNAMDVSTDTLIERSRKFAEYLRNG